MSEQPKGRTFQNSNYPARGSRSKEDVPMQKEYLNRRERWKGISENDLHGIDISQLQLHSKIADRVQQTEERRGFVSYTVPDVDLEKVYEEDKQHETEYAKFAQSAKVLKAPEGQAENFELKRIGSWEELKFNTSLKNNIFKSSYKSPNYVQQLVIPAILHGRSVRVVAETGSGKTEAYVIPIIEKCSRLKEKGQFESKPFSPYAIIIAHSREVVKQIYEHVVKLTTGTNVSASFSIGGYDKIENRKKIDEGCDIFCTTAGRLVEFYQMINGINMKNVKVLVFDEADELLETKDLWNKFFQKMKSKDPEKFFKVHCFSATQIGADTLKKFDELELCKKASIVALEEGPSLPTSNVVHHFQIVTELQKFSTLKNFLIDQRDNQGNPSIIIFCRDYITIEMLSIAYDNFGLDVGIISSKNSQDLRDKVIAKFRSGEYKVLATTDLLSRGIDFKKLDIVVNYDMPKSVDSFIHRVGRCGRIRPGKSFSYVTKSDFEVLRTLKDRFKDNKEIPQTLISTFDELSKDETKAN